MDITQPTGGAATPTDAQLEALSIEAGQHGDLAQVDLCRRALDGDTDAIATCARVLAHNAAQE